MKKRQLCTEKKAVFFFVVNALFLTPLSNEDYWNELFELFVSGDLEGIFHLNSTVGEDLFVSVILVACNLKRYKWARKFKEKYIEFVDCTSDAKKHLKRQTEGFLLFGEKSYTEGINVLREIRVNGPREFFQKNILAIKMYYELCGEEMYLEFGYEYRQHQRPSP